MRASVDLENFTEAEAGDLDDEILVCLQTLRYMVGMPIHVTSGFRRSGTSAHTAGLGVDISDNRVGSPISSAWRHAVLKAVYAVGFRRVGVYNAHLHLDLSKSHDQDVTWIGISD